MLASQNLIAIVNTKLSLVDFFKKTAGRDRQILTMLGQEKNFQVNTTQWRFTLIDLYAFLQRYNNEYQNVSYRRFKKYFTVPR